ncbi:hypothetical protein SASPL_155817 [Salvia splendens]|uniref:C2 domain-containing protein n=1 Tax=Salvia splendens TaxID=180675 RepID=A0A8X8VY47_SALSN|nr:hypothetical protein SASPL_155817 [Salvia splendens]
MASDQPPPPADQPNPPPATVRKLIVEVIEARDLLQGRTGQLQRVLDFVVSDPKTMEFEELNVEVFNDKKLRAASAATGEQPPPPPEQQQQHPPPQMQPEEVMKKPVFVVSDEHQPPPPQMELRDHAPPMENADGRKPHGWERMKVLRRPGNGDYSPRIIAGKFKGDTSERIQAFDLVEPMQYLFVRIVKGRGLSPSENAHVKVRTLGNIVRSKRAIPPPGGDPSSPEWNQVFALGYSKDTAANSTLEISVWDGASERFLGGVCFDLSDVPVRDPPDSPLAPQWYHLEGGATADDDQNRVSGDLQLSVWIGTQADDSFPESLSSDAPQPSVLHARRCTSRRSCGTSV